MPITVIFNNINNDGIENGTVAVENVGKQLFSSEPRNLTEITAEDKKEFNEFIQTITPKEAIEEAIEVISAATAFDHIQVEEIDAPGVEATVEYSNLPR